MSQLVKSRTEAESLPTLFSDFFNTDPFFRPGWLNRELEMTVPAVNIKENHKQFNIELVAPGFKKDDFKVDVEGDVLTISADQSEEIQEEKERYTRKEYSFKTFTRSFTLPANSVMEKIDAKYEQGILKLTLPKKVEAKAIPHREVKVA